MKRIVSVILLIVFLFALVSCGYDEEDIPVFYIKNGTEAYDPAEELIDEFYSTFYKETEADEPDSTEAPVETEDTRIWDFPITVPSETISDTAGIVNSTEGSPDDAEYTVYWVSGGEVWHRTDKCSTLARSKRILSGSIEDAMLAGKKRACKVCYD